MILGPQKLLELVKKENLVIGLAERELTNPEGAGFDLRPRQTAAEGSAGGARRHPVRGDRQVPGPRRQGRVR